MSVVVNCHVEGDRIYLNAEISFEIAQQITKYAQSLMESSPDLENVLETAIKKTVDNWVDEPHYFADDYVDSKFHNPE